jgi:hypothetical protein
LSTPIQPVPDVVLAPEFPTLADRPAGTYNAKAAAWANGENAMAESVRQVALNVRNNAIATQELAEGVEQDKSDAQQAASDAQAAAAAAASTAGAQEWQSGHVYTVGEAVWSSINMQTYRRTTVGAGSIDPSLDPDNWALLGGASLATLHATALLF